MTAASNFTLSSSTWNLKKRALLCRAPGQTEAPSDALLQLADNVAFSLDPSEPTTSALNFSPIVKHPLQQTELTLEGLNWQEVHTSWQQRVQYTAQQYANDPKQEYLALWRLLPEPRLTGSLALPESFRRWWKLLPASPEAPRCTLWEHQSLIAALVGTTRNNRLQPALLQFNIADTQPFITRARRTQDLWAGSYLLSFLAWTMLRFFAEHYGPDCVLQPLLREQPFVDLWLQSTLRATDLTAELNRLTLDNRIANIPNIFTVLLPADDVESAVACAQTSALKKWATISESVRVQVERAARSMPFTGERWAGCDTIWERQTADFLRDNLFWAACPFPADPMNVQELTQWLDTYTPFVECSPELRVHIETFCKRHPQQATGGLLYGLCSRLTAQMLSDRKRARDFNQIYEPGQKCSLSGALQAVVPAWTHTDLQGRRATLAPETSVVDQQPLPKRSRLSLTRQWWEVLAAVDTRGCKMAGHIRRGDRLSAIMTTKRLMTQAYFETPTNTIDRYGEPFLDGHQFPSTASIANARILMRLADLAQYPLLLNTVARYDETVRALIGSNLYQSARLPCWERVLHSYTPEQRQTLESFLELDGEFLYEEMYTAERLQKEFGSEFTVDTDALAQACAARTELWHAVTVAARQHKVNVPAPTRYYAIVAMDGDQMGEWISGRKQSTPLGPALHMGFTAALSGFALRDAPNIVERKHAGKLIYAGGDDVLALLPVSDLLPAMDELYQAFRGSETAPGQFYGFVNHFDGVWERRMGDATLSAGAVIVHESVPLTFAMEQARQAERDAKDCYGRDAFAVRLLKRSGAPVLLGAKWRVSIPTQQTANRSDKDSEASRSASDTVINVPQAVMKAARLMQKDAPDAAPTLSSRLPYSMAETRLEYVPRAWSGQESTLAMARRAEFERLARRHLSATADQFIQEFGALVSLPPMASGASAQANTAQDAWVQTQNLLLLARMIAGGE